MSDNGGINKKDLEKMYKTRKDFNSYLQEIMGANTNLHDLSQDSSDRELSASLSKMFKYSKADFHTDSLGRKDKEIHENLQLHRQLANLQQENKSLKQKAKVWLKVKAFVEGEFHSMCELQSVHVQSPDSNLADEFISEVSQLLRGDNLRKSFDFQESNNHRAEHSASKVASLMIANEKLLIQNESLKSRVEAMKEDRKTRFNSIQTELEAMSLKGEKQIKEIQSDNERLQSQIKHLQQKNSELSQKLLDSESERRNMTSSTSENSETEFLKKIATIREEEINKLKEDKRVLQKENQSVKDFNEKLQRVVTYATSINDQFLKKLEEAAASSANRKLISQEYYPNANRLRQHKLSLGEHRFKIVKSKSLPKILRPRAQKLHD